MDQLPPKSELRGADEPPPVLSTWGRVYAFVIIELACVIALFYWFTVAFRP